MTSFTGRTRKQLIQLIHVGKTQLGMDEDTYRLMLRQLIGVSSVKEATWSELESVLIHMTRLGFKPKRRTQAKAARAPRSLVLGVIQTLWATMHRQGFISDGSELALRSWILKTTRISSPQWLTDDKASRALEQLKQWHKRVMVEKLAIPALKHCTYREVCEAFENHQGGRK